MANTTTLYRATDDQDRLVGSFWTTDPDAAYVWGRDGDCPVLTATVDTNWGVQEEHDGWFTNLTAEELRQAHPDADWVWGTDHSDTGDNRCVVVLTEHGADAFRQGNVEVAATAKEFRFHPCGECEREYGDCYC